MVHFWMRLRQSASVVISLVLYYGIFTFSLKKSCFYLAQGVEHNLFYSLISYLFYYFGLAVYFLPIIITALCLGYWYRSLGWIWLSFTTQLYVTLEKLTIVGGWHNAGGVIGSYITNSLVSLVGVKFSYLFCWWSAVLSLVMIDYYGITSVYYLCLLRYLTPFVRKYVAVLFTALRQSLIWLVPICYRFAKSAIKLIVKGESRILEDTVSGEYKLDKEQTIEINSFFDIENSDKFLPSSETTEEFLTEDLPKEVEPKVKPESFIQRYFMPKSSLLIKREIKEAQESDHAENLVNKLKLFAIQVKCLDIRRGPVVTTYVLEPDANIKLSRILSLEDDIALALEVSSVRIIAPISGTSYIGLEVPNKHRQVVPFKNVIEHQTFKSFSGSLPLVLGYDTEGNAVVQDLAKLPHLLVAGSTGSGKSVAINSMIMGLLYAKKPENLKLILIDPKRLELAPYNDIPHLLFPVATEPNKALLILKWLLSEMERRYTVMAEKGIRSLQESNDLDMPHIVAIIDEFADLIMTSGKELEHCVVRLAQMARAAGIHLVVATQRPSVDVITGLIKANFPSRIAFRVSSKIDSRTIIDDAGAETLLGSGDMLFLSSKGISRLHGSFVADEEVVRVATYVKSQGKPDYQTIEATSISMGEDYDDELYQEIVSYIMDQQEVSISLLQRRFRIGYNRSARIVEQLEKDGYLLSSDGGKMRKVARD